MRVTNQMLNDSARRAGLPVHTTSLLNYMNNDTSTENSLMEALGEKESSSVSPAQKKAYEKIKKAADEYEKAAEKFTDQSEDSVFAKAKASGDRTELYESIDQLIEKYNSTIKSMHAGGGTLDAYYLQMFAGAAADQKEALSSIGITVGKDGSLSADKDKLKAADLESIEKVLGADSAFVTRTGFVAGRTSDHARASAESISARSQSYTNRTRVR